MKTMFHKIITTFGLAAIAGLGVALPASAATFAEWGVWQADEGGDFLTFTDPSLSDAAFSVTNEQTWRIEAPAAGSYVGSFSANSPVGSVVGANTDATNGYALYVETKDDNNETVVVSITFDTAVPSDQLVLALSGVDEDDAVIEMTDGNNVDLTGTEIIGTAADTGFSSDGVSNNIPTVVAGATSVRIDDPQERNDFSTGWVRPSVAVKTITISINSDVNYYSFQRIWIGQIGGSEDVGGSSNEGLAKTGAADSMYLVAFTGAAIVATAGIVRRRTH